MGLDNAYGIGSLKPGICTSTTRPASPYDGQVIYETDTDMVRVWDGSTWDVVGTGVFTSSTRPSSPYEGKIIYETDTDRIQVYDGTAWRLVRPQFAIFNDQKASGTNGGTFTSGSYIKRTLNTTVVNNIDGCSISSSVITLAPGTYHVEASAPAFVVATHKIRLQNTTSSTTIALGTTEFSSSAAAYCVTRSMLSCVFTLTAQSNIELQHRCEVTRNDNGLGAFSNLGDNEVYAEIQIMRLA